MANLFLPYNDTKPYKLYDGILFPRNINSGKYICIIDTNRGESPTTKPSKWLQLNAIGSGTVTSVAASISGALSVSGSPITTTGTLAFTWTGTNAQVVLGDGTLGSVSGGGTVTSIATAGLISGGNPTPITSSGTITTSMNTNKLVGRGTAGVGIMEEITLGTNLSLSGTTLNATGGIGTVTSVNSGININVDNTNPAAPIINSLSDRYKTSSVTSNSVSNGSKSFTVDLNLSYIPLQEILVVYNPSNHMHGEVTSYNSATGALVVDIKTHTGSGTYTSWVLNLDGTPVDALTGSGTTNEIAYFTGAKTLSSLAVATYPSLTELSYVKGVSSAIQTQINGKLSSTLANTNIFVGNASNIATAVAMSSDATIANTGALTIANNAVTYAKMQSVSTTSRLLGSSSTTTPVQEITLGTNLSMSGTTLNATGGSNAGSISITISGFGGVISIGQVGGFMTIPFNGTITGWIISSVDSTGAALSGSCVIGTYKDTYANFPPTSGDEIFTDKPTLTAQSKNQNLAPAFIGAGATVTSGDMVGFYVISCSTCTLINLTLLITKS